MSRHDSTWGTEGSLDFEAPGDGSTNPVTFHPAVDQAGLTVVDLVERHRYTLSTSDGASAETADPDSMLFPVDAAVGVRTDYVAVEDIPIIYVRDGDGGMLAATEPPTDRTFPPGEYYLEICAPIKLYVRVEGPMTVTATLEGKRFDFDDERRVVVGARSKHENPMATVTTTSDPADVMAAISTFGSALKTTSPERSFPTLRGHPPTIDLGDELSIPDGLAAPDTGVVIEVPPEFRYVYPVAPLAHYFGAEVTPADRPRLTTDTGFTHDLSPNSDFESEVERVLKGTFLLDCVTRTEGLYDVALHERATIEPTLDVDFAELYDAPLADRLESYLAVPYETLAPHVPEWTLTTHVTPEPDAVETLPFVVNDLAIIRTESDGSSLARSPVDGPRDVIDPAAAEDGVDEEREEQGEAVEDFFRSPGSAAATNAPSTVDVSTTTSMEHAWIGEGAPRGASKATTVAYRNRAERSPVEGDIDVTVVCNDAAMLDEQDIVHSAYGAHETSTVDVTVQEQLTTDELSESLATDTEFLHYIGHIDDRGFKCVDGFLDASTIESTDVDAFMLNACTSYEQGMALIEAGAVGGIVTLAKVVNESAVRIGSTVARLLNNGYPLRPALDVARNTTYVGDDYIVVGDGSLAVAQGSISLPHLHRVERDGAKFVLEIISYSNVTGGMGTMVLPYLEESDRYYLDSGHLATFCLDETELEDFLALDDVPLLVNGELTWPDAFDPKLL